MIEHSRTHGGSGDIDDNGHVYVPDRVIVTNYLNGTRDLTPLERARADVNGDGRVDKADWDEISFGRSFADKKRANDTAYFTTSDGHFGLGKKIASGSPAATCNSSYRGILSFRTDVAPPRLYICTGFLAGDQGAAWRFVPLSL